MKYGNEVMFKKLRSELNSAIKNDPAGRNKFLILCTYSGIHALIWYEVAHFFYKIKLCFFARLISQFARFLTGIEIHPAAKIGYGLFIDHGAGVVVGETTEIGNNVTLFQGVTLGGTGKEKGKRHPTIKDDVVIYAGAKILGNIVIGKNAVVGAQSVVLKDVPENATVVGIPAKVVKINGVKIKQENELKNLKIEIENLKIEIESLKNNQIE